MSTVTLDPLSDEEYAAWLDRTMRAYADDKVRSGTWLPGEALDRSRAECQRLLPDGPASVGNYLFSIRNQEGQHVGVLWFAVVSKSGAREAFMYDVLVFEEFRLRGYAYAAMKLLEEKAGALGVDKIVLHVFGFNHEALALYQKLGYEISDYTMAKPCPPRP